MDLVNKLLNHTYQDLYLATDKINIVTKFERYKGIKTDMTTGQLYHNSLS